MRYFIFKSAVGTKETGPVYPQTGEMKRNYNFNAYNSVHQLKNDEFPDWDPDLDYFILDEKANLTDMLSNGAIATYGFMVNQKIKNIFQNNNLIPHKFYPAVINWRGAMLNNYFWLHLVGSLLYRHVDFPNSKFYIKKFTQREGEIQINSIEEFHKRKKEIGILKTICATKLKLKDTFESQFDLFLIPRVDGNIYISEKLKEQLINNRVSGIEIVEATILSA